MKDDYKFVYKIVCEPKLQSESKFIDDEFITKVVNNLSTIRLQAIDDSIICSLRELGREKNIDLLIAIDESKIMKMVTDLEILEIIKKKRVDIRLLSECKILKEYNDVIAQNYVSDEEAEWHNELLTETEFNLIKEWLENE